MNAPLNVKDWLFQRFTQLQQAGRLPPAMHSTATQVARQLERQMETDARLGKCERALSAGSIRARLYENKLWPPPEAGAQEKPEREEMASVHLSMQTTGLVEVTIAVNGEVIYGGEVS